MDNFKKLGVLSLFCHNKKGNKAKAMPMTKNEFEQEAKKQKIIDDIIKHMSVKISAPLRKSAATFVQIFYGNISLEDLTEISFESLVDSVLSMWEFLLDRNPNEAKVHIFSKKQNYQGHPISQMIVEVVNDDMPFLVDSVTGAINSLGYSTHLVIHPVIKIERDKNHHLISAFPLTQDGPNRANESLIQCLILGSFSEEKRKLLEAEIKLVLANTRAAVEDWQAMRKELEHAIDMLKVNPPLIPPSELKEIIAFLEWIEDNHFTFLGYCQYIMVPKQPTIQHSVLAKEGLGTLRDPLKQEITNIFEGVELSSITRRYLLEANPLLVTKATTVSLVHRRDLMDSITIKKLDKDKNVVGLFQFIGLFTSVAYNKSVWDIPLLRKKVSNILIRSGFSEKSHDGKTLIHILESFPRDELFQASENWLFQTCMGILQLQNRQRLTLFLREDRFQRFFSCLVYVPRERYDSELRQKISDILERSLRGRVTSWQTQFGELAFARVHFNITLNHTGASSYNLKSIEQELVEASLTWRDYLYQALFLTFGDEKGPKLFEIYGKGFSKGYQEKFSPGEAITDINEIEQARTETHFRACLSYREGKDKSYIGLKIYVLEGPLSLSNILPILENMNFRVLSEIPYIVTLSNNQKVWIHDFEMRTHEGEPVELTYFQDYFLEAFHLIWHEELENDGFNKLIVRANFQWQECQLIRAYAKYLRQLQVTFSQTYMEETLAKYPHICHYMIQLFTCKFIPDTKQNRNSAQEEVVNKIKSLLENVAILDEDRILNKFVNAINSTIRTNYYQLNKGLHKPYLSFKIDSKLIEEMPAPRPKYEIFVYSPRVEAIHLRGGKIARGGIRWSDRREDFRTEVLGLMKAQMVKNAVIVPVGSKGGFIVKRTLAKEGSPFSLKDEVIFCYETMMRGLLDLTDNIRESEIIPPEDVVRWDEDDSYLVVAADKGTATFSDFANQIAKEYDFWLGDAFASGGSSGYDHKKMGITARGAWVSVKRHFRERGIDADEEEISVVGIGDMSGDVFGNGMLLSQHLKLIAAFNHLHIFIDPTPNPSISFTERKRLFDLQTSTWEDYNLNLISKGGGIFDRKIKSIKITPEIQSVLQITEENLAPAELIRHILKAPVELIWFGGIGTFIKSNSESNIDVGDRINDAVRIDGIDVRASVIAEGANLGVTQQGRIEYARKGGQINTDAIDNSAGVDCSDHEVNLKILLGKAIKNNKLNLKERNKLLKEMTADVSHLVLKDNFWQNQSISLTQSQGHGLLDEQARLIRDLESEGLLNRVLENLPDEKEIARRMADKQSLTRPELAILLAYAKISLNHHLIQSELADLAILQPRLLSYFPERLQKTYQEEILTHPLRREITITLFTNSLINRMGITFVHEMKRQLGVKAVDIAKAYFIVRDLLDLVSLWRDLETTETLSPTFQTELMLMIYENVKRMTDWFTRFDVFHRNTAEIILLFKSDFLSLKKNLPSFFPPKQYKIYETKYKEYLALGLSASLAERLLTLKFLVSAPDMILLSKELQKDIKTVAKIYFALGQQLGFEWLRNTALGLMGETHWSQGAANTLIEDFYTSQIQITKKILKSGKSVEQILNKGGIISDEFLSLAEVEITLVDLMNAAAVDFAMMTVINRQLHLLAREG